MSSDDGIDDYHRSGSKSHYYQQLSPKKPSHQPLSIHNENSIGGSNHHHQSNHSIASASTQTLNCCDINGGGTIKRRKSASTATSSTLSAVAIAGLTPSCDRSNDDDDLHMLSSGSLATPKSNSNGGGNSMCASPSRYMHQNDSIYLHLGGSNNCMPNGNRLSIHHPSANDRFDSEITTCCLPPPSPAPNSDRFIMGMPSPSIAVHHSQHQTQHFQSPNGNDIKFATMHHRSMSPSSRYKSTISDRYRDVSPKCDRFLPPPHYLANSTPLVSSGGSINNISMVGANSSSSDNYIDGYLSTTVHTPVKRYVPSTNTTAVATESTVSMSTCTMNGYHHHTGTADDYYAALRRNIRRHCRTSADASACGNTACVNVACVSSESDTAMSSASVQLTAPVSAVGLNTNRSLFRGDGICRSSGKATSSNGAQNSPGPTALGENHLPSSNRHSSAQTLTQSPASSLSTSFGLSSSGSGSNSSASSVRSSMRNSQNDHATGAEAGGNVAGSDAYNNMPSSTMIPANGGSNSGNGTCLHCSTIRRTTGVHQTTQTGPISPTIPQNPALPATQWDANTSVDILPATVAQLHRIASQDEQRHRIASQDGMQRHRIVSQDSLQPATAQQQQQQLQMQFHQQHQQQQQQQQQQQLQSQDSLASSSQMSPDEASIDQSNPSRKHQIKQYVKREVAKFFGVDVASEERERVKWSERQKRLALRRFGTLKPGADILGQNQIQEQRERELHGDRPDILPVDHIPSTHYHSGGGGGGGSGAGYHHRNHMNAPRGSTNAGRRQTLEDEIDIDDDDDDDDDDVELENRAHNINNALNQHLIIERKASVPTMLWLGMQYAIQALSKKMPRNQRQWSRSFAPQYIHRTAHSLSDGGIGHGNNHYDGIAALHDSELFFDSPSTTAATNGNDAPNNGSSSNNTRHVNDASRHLYMSNCDRNQQQPGGWRTRNSDANATADALNQQQQAQPMHGQQHDDVDGRRRSELRSKPTLAGFRTLESGRSLDRCGTRISSHLLEGVLDNSRRPHQKKLKLLHVHELDDRYDHRPYFTYWINTVQILVLCLTLVCYGFGPIGIGMEQKNGQVLVTSLSLQQVQHHEPRNIWLGPRGDDLVHLGAKFAACMRRDLRILDVMAKTRRQERETACCIRNDDSGCVQSSQADCSVRGLWPTKSISTWKKWSPGESGPGGRISGSVCGLDPKYCDAPASIAPYEWPDDITKWPICRKTNSFSQRFRYKDHTAEHMVCEVIGHPCCISVYGECRITTKEFCDFVNGYFHEEASLCSQVSCLNDICGMFPFISPDIPDQFYRLFTSLCLHAGLIHLAITIAFQHIFMADLERLLGPIRTAVLYIGSGVAGNLTSSIFLPYKPEVGPLASIAGVVSSMAVLLLTIHWKQLKRPHMALMKLIFLAMCIFAIGTLPWQQHIVGLMGGIICGTVLTITMVPFLSITKYGRKSKINLVWSCIALHLVIYSSMFILFYLFPMALSSIGWWGTDSLNINNPYNGAIGGGYSVGGNIVACDNNKGMQCGGTSSNSPGGIVRSAINI